MARLIDDLRATDRLNMPWYVGRAKHKAWFEHQARLRPLYMRRDFPVILIDNVADYFYSGTDQENWDLRDHFPNIAPPWRTAWFEHRMPRQIRSEEFGTIDSIAPKGRVGFLMFAQEEGDLADNGGSWPDQPGWPPGTRWIIRVEMFMDFYGRPDSIEGASGPWSLRVDADGRAAGTPFIQTWTAPDQNEYMQGFQSFLYPPLLAMCFSHCKNVVMEDHEMPAPLVKKFRAKHGNKSLQPAAWKTLVIEPMKQVLRREGKAESTGLQRALHICRGHFADYTQGRGLFGKFHGRYWIPQTVRGTVKGGVKSPPEREVVIKL